MTEEVDEDAGLRGALLREYFRERRERGLEYKNDYPEGSEDWKLARLAEEIRRRWDRELFFWAITSSGSAPEPSGFMWGRRCEGRAGTRTTHTCVGKSGLARTHALRTL